MKNRNLKHYLKQNHNVLNGMRENEKHSVGAKIDYDFRRL